MGLYRRLVEWISHLRFKASRKRYKAQMEETWDIVWPDNESGYIGLYLLVRENGRCPDLYVIKKNYLSIILWCN